jgi:predicted Zn-dependent protease
MAQAGYDPREAVIFWQRMADMSAKSGSNTPEYFSTHPSDARRISQIQSLLPEALQSYKQAGGAG